MELSTQPEQSPTIRFISTRMVIGLGVGVILQALLVCVAALGPLPGIRFSEVLYPEVLAPTLVGFAIVWGLWLAPLWFKQTAELTSDASFSAFFLGIWQAAALGFFLLVASRLSVISLSGAIQAMLIVATATTFSILFASRWPGIFPGLVMFWVVVLPMTTYLFSEIFLSTPAGAIGYTQAAGPEAPRLHTLMNLFLSVSPGTAAVGALQGELASGMRWGWKVTTMVVGGLGLASAGLVGLNSLSSNEVK